MSHLRLVYSRSGGTLTGEEHARQKAWVQMSQLRSATKQERRDETASYARLYVFPRVRVENVVPRDPRPAA